MGAWFPKDKGAYIQTFEPMGKIQMSKGEPIKNVNYPFLVFFPNHLFLPEMVELVIAWDGQGMEVNIRIGQSTHFGKSCFDFLGK